MFAGEVGAVDTALGDAVTLAVWTLLATAAVWVLTRRPAARCGVWIVVASACVVVAVDKALDVQYLGYRALRVAARALEALLDVPEHDPRVRAGLLVAATVAAVAALAVVGWRDRPWDAGKGLGAAGIGLVVAWVGLRFVPWSPWLADARIGWGVEAVACSCIAAGLWHTRRGSGQPAGSRTNRPVSDGSTK